MKKLKIGVVGAGGISVCHMDSYKKNDKVELYALCDIREEHLKKVAENYNIKNTFTDLHEMLKLEELDAVSVCTCNSEHANASIAALNAGKHVLCEKPMALNSQQAEEMKAAADRSGKLLMIGFVRRFGNDCSILKDFIDNDYFGDIYYAKSTYLRRNGNPGGWFKNKALSGGGPLIDLGVHVIDLTRYLAGRPKPVSVYGATFQKLFDRPGLKDKISYAGSRMNGADVCDVEDLVSALIRFDNGMVIAVEASFSLNIKADTGTIELFGTKAGAKLDPGLEIYTDLNNRMVNVSLVSPTALDFNGLFENEINHFVSCITDGTECISPAEDGVLMMKILDAIYESGRTGHEVIIK